MFASCLSLFYDLFYHFEDSGVLDPDDNDNIIMVSTLRIFAYHKQAFESVEKRLDTPSDELREKQVSNTALDTWSTDCRLGLEFSRR